MNRERAAAAATTLALALGVTLTGCGTGQNNPTPAVATADNAVTHEQNDRVPEGAKWTQHYFPSSDGSEVQLHADVLRPEGLADDAKVPVILSAGAYFGHSGQQADEHFAHTGPSDRFGDLVNDGGLLDRGYALVMVDVRGFGGSTGCLDFAGPGEQADVKAAIDWAAEQPWSTGSVGMYGKSFDAITGLAGNNLGQDALKAVVAQEPIWDLHRNFRSNGVPRTTIVAASGTYNQIADLPQLPDDDEHYRDNAAYEKKHPECLLQNTTDYQIADPDSEYWRARDFAANAKGTDTPIFITQGFLEWNTEAEGVQEFLDNHEGPERGWLGQWDHRRGNERMPDGKLATGRDGWLRETMSFFDQYVKGIAPQENYPAFAVQDSTGAWRAQDTWPVVERNATTRLGGGSYVDDGAAPGAANTFVHRSEPFAHDTRITGTPRISVPTEGHGNLMVTLYDVAPDGSASGFDRQVSTVRPGTTNIELRSTDWTIQAGHSLAVEFGTIAPGYLDNDWIDTPSNETITVRDAQLDLATNDPAHDTPTPGARAPWLDTYLAVNTKPLPGIAPTFTVENNR
ncbi:CocE/NonD family hydrolase [Nocardia callitridis]|uniref:CocE/NonD family hydrolase n=1 Tax=Nocardia callitridis TaxID=648753 RepID=A0ABP9KVR3_9NOCA